MFYLVFFLNSIIKTINDLQISFFRPKKYIRISRDDFFSTEEHYLSNTPARAEKACAYDLDDIDIAWLEVLNGERAQVRTQLNK